MNEDLFSGDDGNTELTAQEKLDLIPSLSTRSELNEFERTNIHAARVWALRRRNLARTDLLTDTFSRELRKRYIAAIKQADVGNFAALVAFARS